MRAWIWTATLVGASALGCGHESPTWESAKNELAVAYDDVRSGARRTATAGKYALTDVGDGVVQVTDRSKETYQSTSSQVQDGWITAKVKADLATTKGIRSGDIHADTRNGVVRLSGVVDGPVTAQRAIDRTLAVRGVQAVDANLQYPTQTQPSRIYTPK